jgi:hypothetical protein
MAFRFISRPALHRRSTNQTAKDLETPLHLWTHRFPITQEPKAWRYPLHSLSTLTLLTLIKSSRTYSKTAIFDRAIKIEYCSIRGKRGSGMLRYRVFHLWCDRSYREAMSWRLERHALVWRDSLVDALNSGAHLHNSAALVLLHLFRDRNCLIIISASSSILEVLRVEVEDSRCRR